MGRRLVNLFLFFFFIFGITQPLFSLSKILLFGRLFDFGLYRESGQTFLSGGSMYLQGDMNCPPTNLFLFILLNSLPIFFGQIIWTIFSFFCLFFSFWFSVKSLNLKLSKNDILFLVPLLLLSFPVKWTFGLGQINNLILLLLVLTYFFSQKGKESVSGIILGVAISLKIIPISLLLYFLVQKKVKTLVVTMATVITSFVLSSFVFGFGLMKEYFLTVVPKFIGPSGKHIYYNQALSGFIARVSNEAFDATILNITFSILILLVTLYFLNEAKEKGKLGYSLLISTPLLINPYLSWQHHFVWLLFPFLTVFSYLGNKKAFLLKTLLFISYLLVAFNIKQPDLWQQNFFGRIFLSHVFLGNFLLWGMLVYLIRHEVLC